MDPWQKIHNESTTWKPVPTPGLWAVKNPIFSMETSQVVGWKNIYIQIHTYIYIIKHTIKKPTYIYIYISDDICDCDHAVIPHCFSLPNKFTIAPPAMAEILDLRHALDQTTTLQKTQATPFLEVKLLMKWQDGQGDFFPMSILNIVNKAKQSIICNKETTHTFWKMSWELPKIQLKFQSLTFIHIQWSYSHLEGAQGRTQCCITFWCCMCCYLEGMSLEGSLLGRVRLARLARLAKLGWVWMGWKEGRHHSNPY